jgi:integrase
VSSAKQQDLFQPGIPESDLPPLPPLPARIRSHEGDWIDISTDVWRIPTRTGAAAITTLNLTRIWNAATLTPRSQDVVRHYLAHRVSTAKPKTVDGDVAAVRLFLCWWREHQTDFVPFDWRYVRAASLRRFLAWGLETPNMGNDFSRLRHLYRWAVQVKELPDFDPREQMLLSGMRAPGNAKGEAVRSWNDENGPFDWDEYNLILNALKERKGKPRDRVIIRTLLETGARPFVVSLIRARHLHCVEAMINQADGSIDVRVEYWLEMPVLKDRSPIVRKWKRRPISTTLGRWLAAYRQARRDAGHHDDSWHLFDWAARKPAVSCRQAVDRWADDADLVSPRTGKRLVLNPRRFRYTLGTFMAMQGHSRVEIAEALDHTDLQNVEVYIDAAAGFMAQLSAPIERALGPAIRRFLGRVAEAPDCGVAGGVIPAAVSYLPDFPMISGAVGWCGRDPGANGLCKFAHPLACYGCRSFTAFRHGPHGEIADALERLITEQREGTSPLLLGQLRESLAAVRQLEAQIAAEEADA